MGIVDVVLGIAPDGCKAGGLAASGGVFRRDAAASFQLPHTLKQK
jgi:hypothetical protein